MDIYGLIGFPLAHSFSRTFFNQKFAAENIDAEYRNFDIPDIGDVTELIAEYPELKGFNVTRPYKELIISSLDDIDKEAKGVGAVNVVKIEGDTLAENFVLKGYNSDVYGFTKSIKPLLKPDYCNALILGTGGASKAVKYSLNQLGIECALVSRQKGKADFCYEDLNREIMSSYLVIVNATPAGQIPEVESCPPIPYQFITSSHLCFDLVYNPELTLFLKLCREKGAKVKNGIEMLLLQAQRSWEIWNE